MSAGAAGAGKPGAEGSAGPPVFEKKPFRFSVLPVAAGLGAGAVAGPLLLGAGAIGLSIFARTIAPLEVLGNRGALLGAAALGGVFGGLAGGFLQKSAHDESEEQRRLEIVGTPADQVAADFIAPFDHNENGRIDLDNDTGLSTQDERVRVETRVQSEGGWEYDWWDDDIDYETDRYTERRGHSAVNLWRAANADDDPVVTAGEVADLLRAEEAVRNGYITTSERAAFEQSHPMIVEEWRR